MILLLTDQQLHAEKGDYYMIAAGYKMPHTALHVPWRYFDMYRSRSKVG